MQSNATGFAVINSNVSDWIPSQLYQKKKSCQYYYQKIIVYDEEDSEDIHDVRIHFKYALRFRSDLREKG